MGEVEEEPEGDMVAGPSSKATTHNSGTISLLFIHIYIIFFFFFMHTLVCASSV